VVCEGVKLQWNFVTDEAMFNFTHEILLALTFTVWHLNAFVAADG